MIWKNGKTVAAIYHGKRAIAYVYHGSRLVWQAIMSCYGTGRWINNAPWKNNDAWKNQ